MRLLPILFLFGLAACGQQADPGARQLATKGAAAPTATAAQSVVAGKPAMSKAGMIPVPTDKQQLGRLLAMGYTIHEDHMHPPGVKECPFDRNGGMIQ